VNLPLPFVHLAWTIDREENKLNKKAAVAILMCAVMVLVAAAPLAMSVSDHAHHVVKSTKGPRWDAVTWGFTPPSLGIWKGQITNNGLFWILVDVNDNTTGVPESIMHQRIQFIGDKMLFPTGAIDTQGAVMNNHHTYEITITPQGKIGTSCDVKDTFKLGVAPVAAIDVTSIIDLNVTVDGSRSYDPDGEIMGYMWDFGDRFIESESIECVVTGVTAKHTYAMAGTYDITLVVVDNDGITAEAVQRVSLETVPTVPPVLDPIGAKTVNEMTLLTFTATATDADTPVQTLTFSLSGTVPAGASITSAGVFTWTPTEAQGPGDYTFNVVVSDGSQTDSETITVHVNEVNVAPVLGAIGAKTVNELALLTFTATATDADIPVQTLTYSLSGTVPAGASITSAGVFTWTPSAIGDYTFDVVVSDGSLTDSETITVHVVATSNTPPVLGAIGAKTVNELALLTFTATATDADIPVQTLTYSLSGTVPAGASITSAGVFTWTPTEAQGPGDYTFTVVVSDGSLTASQSVSVRVNEVNVAPVLAPIGNKVVDEMSLLTFTATATDADIPVQTLTFSLSGTVPAGASITSAGVFTWTPTEAQGPGSYSVTVVVSDGSLTASQTVAVQVNEVNVAPVLGAIGAKTVNELALLTFTATATDADIPVQTLTYSLSGTVPAGASITSAGVFTWTPTEAQGPGDYTFTVVVSDGSLTASQSVSVRVNEVNVAPVLAPIGNKVVDEMSLLTFTATATDADIPVQTLTFSLSGTVPAGASITSAGVFTWTPTEAQGPGDYTFNVVVSDGALTASETITVHVNEDNAPTASFTWTVSGLTVNVDASLSSDDKGIVSYVWNWGDGTTGTGKTATHTYTAPAPAPRAIVSAPIALAPGPPYLLWGYTTDALGTPYECYVTITNLRTGQVGTTDSFQVDPWPLDGYYEFDLQNGLPSAYLVGDMIKVDVVSVSGTMTGSNQAAVPGGPSMNIDVTLTGGTPQPFDRIITLTVTDIKGQTSTISKTVTLYP